MAKILLIEDHLTLSQIMIQVLEARQHKVLCARKLSDAELLMERQLFDLVIADRSLPDGDGLDLVVRLHNVQPGLPVIIVSNRALSQDRITGLQKGADDYLPKPFSTEELLLRVEKLLHVDKRIVPDQLKSGVLTLYKSTGKVKIGESTIQLRPKEFRLLWFLVAHQQSLLTRRQIISHLWPETEHPLSETLDVYIRRVRRALGAEGKHIRTVKGFGYLWQPQL